MLAHSDILILKHLRKNARKSLAKLSREEGIPVSTIFSKVSRLESSFIKKNTSLLDFPKMGYGLTTFMLIKLKDSSRKEVIGFLSNHPNTNRLSKINNGFDLFIESIFENMKSYNNFIENLNQFNIKNHVFFAIEELKKEDFLTRDEHLELFK